LWAERSKAPNAIAIDDKQETFQETSQWMTMRCEIDLILYGEA